VSLGSGCRRVIATGLGTLIGALAGFYRGFVDGLLMRFTDVMLSIPPLPPSPALRPAAPERAASGRHRRRPDLDGHGAPVRSQFLGAARTRVLEPRGPSARGAAADARHILPNAIGRFTVSATLAVGSSIMLERALSFLGSGSSRQVPTWGNAGTPPAPGWASHPGWRSPPGLCIFGTVLA